jgi:hypothetical protein
VFRSSLLVACFLVGAALTSCSVDDRTLQADVAANGGVSGGSDSGNAGRAATSGSSGTAEAGAANAGAADFPGEGGTTGEPNAPPQPPISVSGDCADLDEDKAPDCKQDLLSNPDFDSDVSKWSAEAGAAFTWDPGDALGNSGSGSALLATASDTVATPGSVSIAASQCVAVTGDNIVGAYANVFVDADQASNGVASVDVYFFDAAGCAGTATVHFSTPQPLDASAGTWVTLRGGLTAPKATHSVQVRLTIAKQNQAASFQARFDNVLVKQIAPK